MSSPTFVLAIIYLPLLINCLSGLRNVNNLEFNPTGKGVIPATDRIQAEDFDYAQDMVINDDCSADATTIVGTEYSGNRAEYYQLDFGQGVQKVMVRGYSESYDTQTITFRFGNSSNAAFATAKLPSYTEKCNFVETMADVVVLPVGVQNLFVSFDDDGYYTYLESFVFVREEAKLNATDKIEAEDYTSAGNVSLYEDCGNSSDTYVGQLQSNSVLEYDALDFGSGVETVTLRVSSIHNGPPLNVTLHLGTSTSSPLANVIVGPTGSERCDFYTVTTFLNTQPNGVQNLFFTFPAREGGYLNFDWFQFNQTLN